MTTKIAQNQIKGYPATTAAVAIADATLSLGHLLSVDGNPNISGALVTGITGTTITLSKSAAATTAGGPDDNVTFKAPTWVALPAFA